MTTSTYIFQLLDVIGLHDVARILCVAYLAFHRLDADSRVFGVEIERQVESGVLVGVQVQSLVKAEDRRRRRGDLSPEFNLEKC